MKFEIDLNMDEYEFLRDRYNCGVQIAIKKMINEMMKEKGEKIK